MGNRPVDHALVSGKEKEQIKKRLIQLSIPLIEILQKEQMETLILMLLLAPLKLLRL